MIDTYQLQEPINTDAECPVIPVHDYKTRHYFNFGAFLAGREHYLRMKHEIKHGKIPVHDMGDDNV